MAKLTRGNRIQVCGSSLLGKRRDLLTDLRAAGCVVEVEECLDRCIGCDTRTFALVCGRFVSAVSPEEFRRKVQP